MVSETIIIIIALLLPPVVLWRCKNFCEKHPSTVPFRTVPIGCLTMFCLMLLYCSMVPWLFHKVLETNIPHWLDAAKELPILLLAIPLGIAVIMLLSKRLLRGKEKPNGCLYPVVFAGALILSLAISFCCTFWHRSDQKSRAWHSIFLPRVNQCLVVFEQRPTHPFLAEYDYRIRLEQGQETAYFQLWPNTGGRTFINVYQVAEDKLLLKDKQASYIIDTTRLQVYLVDYADEDGKPLTKEIHFAVPLSSVPFHSLGHNVPLSETESDTDTEGDHLGKYLSIDFTDGTTGKAIPYDVSVENCVYLGCIMDYSFYTPEEKPEGEGHPRYRNRNNSASASE